MDTTQIVAAAGGDEPIAASGPFQEHLSCSSAYKLVSSVVLCVVPCVLEGRGCRGDFVRKLQEEAEQLSQEYIETPQQLLELTDA